MEPVKARVKPGRQQRWSLVKVTVATAVQTRAGGNSCSDCKLFGSCTHPPASLRSTHRYRWHQVLIHTQVLVWRESYGKFCMMMFPLPSPTGWNLQTLMFLEKKRYTGIKKKITVACSLLSCPWHAMNVKGSCCKKTEKKHEVGTEGVFFSEVGAGLRIGDKRWTALEEASAWQGRNTASAGQLRRWLGEEGRSTENKDTTRTHREAGQQIASIGQDLPTAFRHPPVPRDWPYHPTEREEEVKVGIERKRERRRKKKKQGHRCEARNTWARGPGEKTAHTHTHTEKQTSTVTMTWRDRTPVEGTPPTAPPPSAHLLCRVGAVSHGLGTASTRIYSQMCHFRLPCVYAKSRVPRKALSAAQRQEVGGGRRVTWPGGVTCWLINDNSYLIWPINLLSQVSLWVGPTISVPFCSFV